MSLPDALAVLLRRRKLILLNTAVLTILAVIVSLVLPHKYAATARLLPPPEDDPLGLTAQLSLGLSGQLGRLGSTMLGGGTSSDLMLGILSSNTVMESVAVKCSVISRYRIKRGSREEAVRELTRMTDLSVGDEGIVAITVEARRPEWAAEMANCYVSQLDFFLRNSNMSRGRNMRVFMEGRLAEVIRGVSSARESLTAYQTRSGLVAPDEQLRGMVASYAELYAGLLAKQVGVRVFETRSSSANPFLDGFRAEIATYERQLARLHNGRRADDRGLFGLTLDSLPAVTAEYLRRYGEFTLLEATHAMLSQQLEHARILEARDTPTITVLDHAAPPERRSFPRRFIIVLAALLFGLVGGVAFALVAEYFDRVRDLHPDEHRAWEDLRRQWAVAWENVTRVLSLHKCRGADLGSLPPRGGADDKNSD
ncbi:MAG: Wzz/FepE/Etk N-terminal domain-containing protein [bacterium]